MERRGDEMSERPKARFSSLETTRASHPRPRIKLRLEGIVLPPRARTSGRSASTKPETPSMQARGSWQRGGRTRQRTRGGSSNLPKSCSDLIKGLSNLFEFRVFVSECFGDLDVGGGVLCNRGFDRDSLEEASHSGAHQAADGSTKNGDLSAADA